MSIPVTPEYNIAMQSFTNLSCTTTKQHNETTRIREEDIMYIRLSASMLRQISQARRRALVKRHKQRVIPIVSDELRER